MNNIYYFIIFLYKMFLKIAPKPMFLGHWLIFPFLKKNKYNSDVLLVSNNKVIKEGVSHTWCETQV